MLSTSSKPVDDVVRARRLPVGAEILGKDAAQFRVWAPDHDGVDLVIEGSRGADSGQPPRIVRLNREDNGYHSALVPGVAAGALYRFKLGDALLADPASRFQADGPNGPSQIVDPDAFTWTDQAWAGPQLKGLVIYEMHVGTFTREGTWRAAEAELPALADLGINAIEMMPVADFPGQFGWGYDGVCLFAPTRLYGQPDDLRRFVDRAHALGIAVLLDVVYNHLGPDGNVLTHYTARYFSDSYTTEWGDAPNFDGEACGAVREFFLANAGYWVAEFHFDGVRIDATQSIFDASEDHILNAIGRRIRDAAGSRRTVIIAENEEQNTALVRPADHHGHELDALWNDDFHHAAVAAATGRDEAYFADYRGTPQELISAVKWGALYQGQRNTRQGKHRGTPAFDIEPARWVAYLENHDQTGNNPGSVRLSRLTSPGRLRALTAMLLLSPGTPLLFQGQEFASSRPFFYFGDQKPEIAQSMYAGRKQFLTQFASQATTAMQERIPRPDDPQAFERCKLDHAERARHAETYAMHRDLLRLRRDDAAFRAQRARAVDGAVLGSESFVLRFFVDGADGDRLLVVNLGHGLHIDPVAEPLLAPMPGTRWTILWSSEDPAYGGGGTAPLDTERGWRIPGHAAVALAPERGGPKRHD
jgi:maltooligosyltrehalose trehalohydrolase